MEAREERLHRLVCQKFSGKISSIETLTLFALLHELEKTVVNINIKNKRRISGWGGSAQLGSTGLSLYDSLAETVTVNIDCEIYEALLILS